MLIREANISDALGIARVGVDTWRTTYRGLMADEDLDGMTYEASEARWKDRLADPVCFTFVAETDAGEIIAYANSGLEREGDPIYEGEIYGLYVLKEHQKSGIGKSLVAATVRRFIESDIHSMLIWVLSENPAMHFYERIGGRPLRTKLITLGGRDLEETAFGWDDLGMLVDGF